MPIIPEALKKHLPTLASDFRWRPNCDYEFGINPAKNTSAGLESPPAGSIMAFPVWIDTGDDNAMVYEKLKLMAPEVIAVVANALVFEKLALTILPDYFATRRDQELFDPQQDVAKWYWVYIIEKERPQHRLRSNEEF